MLLALGVAPKPLGVGVEQRAARTLMALATRGPVHVLWYGRGRFAEALDPTLSSYVGGHTDLALGGRSSVVPWLRHVYLRWPAGPAPPGPLSAALARLLPFEGAPASLPSLPPDLAGRTFAAVHGFRLTSAPLVVMAGAVAPLRSVDMDDLESDTLADIADLAMRAGDRGFSWLMRAQSMAAARFERRWLHAVDRLACCSATDARQLQAAFPRARVHVVPNAIGSVPARRRAPGAVDPRCVRLLVIGALGYYPNIEAARFLASQVLPAAQGLCAPRDVELNIVGYGASPALRRWFVRQPGVVFHGGLENLDAIYERCDIALCAVRVGGGTRIKILEAFARGLPVVSTRRGAAGMALADGRELLYAESPAEFANAIERILNGAGLTDMIERAARFVREAHGARAFEDGILALTTT